MRIYFTDGRQAECSAIEICGNEIIWDETRSEELTNVERIMED